MFLVDRRVGLGSEAVVTQRETFPPYLLITYGGDLFMQHSWTSTVQSINHTCRTSQGFQCLLKCRGEWSVEECAHSHLRVFLVVIQPDHAKGQVDAETT